MHCEGALTDSSTDTNRYPFLQVYMLWCPLSPLIIAGAHAGLSCLYSLPEAEKQMWIQGQPTRLKTQQAPVQQTCTHTAESTARTFASTPSHSPAVCFQSLSHGTDIASGPELETQPHSNQSATWTWTTNTSQMTPSLHYTSNAQILTNDRGRPSLAYGILDEQIILSAPHIYIYIYGLKKCADATWHLRPEPSDQISNTARANKGVLFLSALSVFVLNGVYPLQHSAPFNRLLSKWGTFQAHQPCACHER